MAEGVAAAASLNSLDEDMVETARADLAAAFRWFERMGMNEGISNHFSVAVSEDGAQFLINPYGVYWSQMRASDLLLLDARVEPTDLGDAVDPTAWAIHGALHRQKPQARCVMHLHSRYATALSTLEDPTLPPIDQTTMRFYNRLAVDAEFGGMGLGDEAERMAAHLGDKKTMVMGNHGVMTAASSVAEAFDLMFHFERACETYLIALASGRKLREVSDAVAETTARQWEDYASGPDKHLAGIRAVLDVEEPDYRD